MMRTPTVLALTLLLSAPALAWVPKLEETTAKIVIDSAYARRDAVPTFQTIDLNVEGGKFKSGEGALKAFDGGEKCVSDWLSAPGDFKAGSRVATITVSGQADQLYFAAQEARDNFKNLTVKDALAAFSAGFLPHTANNFGEVYTATTTVKQEGSTTTATTTGAKVPAQVSATPSLADGELRVDINIRGLFSDKARGAYLVRLKGADNKLLAPLRNTYVNDWKQDAGTWSGTLVYYFQPLKAGLGASDKVELLIRTEADSNCAYSVVLDLGSFQ